MKYTSNVRTPNLSSWVRYGIAAVSVGVVLILRELLQPYLGVEAPLLIFLISVMISAWIGGLGPGILATILATVAGIYYFIKPTHSFFVSELSDTIRVALFVSEGILLSVLNQLLLSAKARLEKSLTEEKKAKIAAEEANRTKTQFLATMSHEIRTPMTSILGFTDILKQSGLSDQQRLQFIGTVQRNGELLLSLIDDLLDISRIEANKLNIEYSTVKIEGLISETASSLEQIAKKKGVQLKFEIEPNVPKFVYTDPTRVRQILNNLIGNAIKFSKDGKVLVSIGFSAKEPGTDQVTITVRDSGIGIKGEQIDRLFKPFSQGDAKINREFGGTGLGLAISRHLTRNLGGDLWLEKSTPGQGSVFIATISPNLEKRINFKSPEQQRTEIAPKSLQGIRILLADDCEDIRELYSTFLTERGALVTLVPDGREAIREARSRHYDIILMDVEMPELDGCSATNNLRLVGYTRPIIAITAHAMIEAQDRCIEVGYDDVIAKPASSSNLVDRILHYHRKI